MITRKLDWVRSIEPENGDRLQQLEKRLAEFYSKNSSYYSEIDFTSGNWINPAEVGYQEIVHALKDFNSICEVGCGSANILHHHPDLASRYSGCDFSADLVEKNRVRYPGANFAPLVQSNHLPFESETFDLVFSVFVLEHSTNPSKLLSECSRILKKDGKLIILCPDFLGSGKMTSQRAGWSEGTASIKLRAGRILDAFVTLYDNRVRIPSYCKSLRVSASKNPLFMVNLNPVVFEDRFSPDVDAVYVTFKEEIINFLRPGFVVIENDPALSEYEVEKKLIFLSLRKIPA